MDYKAKINYNKANGQAIVFLSKKKLKLLNLRKAKFLKIKESDLEWEKVINMVEEVKIRVIKREDILRGSTRRPPEAMERRVARVERLKGKIKRIHKQEELKELKERRKKTKVYKALRRAVAAPTGKSTEQATKLAKSALGKPYKPKWG